MAKELSFGTGITAFAFEVILNEGNLEHILDKVDSLDLPKQPKPSFEVLLMHNPEHGVDLDNPKNNHIWAKKLGKSVTGRGYELIFCGFHPGSSNAHFLAEIQPPVDRALHRTKAMIDFVEQAGSNLLVGPVHIEHGRKDGLPIESLVNPLRQIGNYARERDVRVGIELINGLETYALNSVATILPLLHEVNSPNLGVHYDVAHGERHERGQHVTALSKLIDAGKLFHFHANESDRAPYNTNNQSLTALALPTILQYVNNRGWNGHVNLEAFHYDLWRAVGREDTLRAHALDKEARNDLAYKEAKQSIDYLKSVFTEVQSRAE